jgi:hypothetical protein
MEKSSKKIDKITQQIIKSGGLHQPSADFMENVMGAVSMIETEKVKYTPLISKKVWIVLSVSILATFCYMVFFTSTDYTMIGNVGLLERISNVNFALPELNLSKELIYGIGFLGLFLLQIPFLKRQLDRVQY